MIIDLNLLIDYYRVISILSKYARDIGVTFDCVLNFECQITYICKSCYLNIRTVIVFLRTEHQYEDFSWRLCYLKIRQL